MAVVSEEEEIEAMAVGLVEGEGPWKEMLREILEFILNRLPTENIVRFKLVCKSWARAASELLLPWARFHQPWIGWVELDKGREPTFFSIQEQRYYFFTLEAISESALVFGSVEGWVILLEDLKYPVLINPMTYLLFDLPVVNATIFYRVALSGVPSGEAHAIAVVAMVRNGSALNFTWSGYEDWHLLCDLSQPSSPYDSDTFLDISYNNGTFLGLLRSGRMLSFDLTAGDLPEARMLASTYQVQDWVGFKETKNKVLVSSCTGDLFLVRWKDDDSAIIVLKYDPESDRWQVVEDLDDGVIFLDYNQALFLSSACGLKPNSIYICCGNSGLPEVYDMEARSFSSFVAWHLEDSPATRFWFLPSPSRL